MGFSRLIKKVSIGILAGAFVFSLVGCGSEKAVTTNAMEKDTLVVGLDDTFAPMGFKDEQGELVGYDIDLMHAMEKEIGKNFELQSINWDMKESELNAGNIDLIWNGYSINEQRKEMVNFTEPYLENKQIIITLADSPIETKADLAGKKVGAQAGSSAVEAMEKDADVYASLDGAKAVTYETNNDVLMDLEAGRIDAAVADEVVIRYYISNRGPEKYKILEENFGEEQYGIGVRKSDTELLEALNKGYEALKADGTVKEISEKWFGEDISK